MHTHPCTPSTHRSGLVVFARPVAVLHQTVQDAADTKRGLNDIGHVFAIGDEPRLLFKCHNFALELDLAACDLGNGQLDPALALHVERELFAHILCERIERSLDRLGVFFKARAGLFLIEHGHPLFDAIRLFQRLSRAQRLPRRLLVYRQIVRGPVRAAHALGPAVRVEQLAVPAV
jgi:hypothetical protein